MAERKVRKAAGKTAANTTKRTATKTTAKTAAKRTTRTKAAARKISVSENWISICSVWEHIMIFIKKWVHMKQ